MTKHTGALGSALACLAFLAAGCSLDAPQSSNGLTIKIQDSQQARGEAAMALFDGYDLGLDGSLQIQSTPSSNSDFNCFVANITGTGIQGSNQYAQCGTFTSTDNMRGAGFGIISAPTPRGSSIQASVQAGPARTIQVYGIYPTIPQCGGQSSNTGSWGYFLGSITQDLTQAAASVTVGINYDQSAGQLKCTQNGSSSIPTAVLTDVSYVSATCPTHSTILNVTPGALGLTSLGTSLSPTNCSGSTTSMQLSNQVQEYTFSLQGGNINAANTLTVSWTGIAAACGVSESGCPATIGSTLYVGDGQAGVSVYNGTTSSWVAIGSGLGTASTTNTVSSSFSQPSQFLYNGNIVVRAYGDGPLNTSYCGTTGDSSPTCYSVLQPSTVSVTLQ